MLYGNMRRGNESCRAAIKSFPFSGLIFLIVLFGFLGLFL